jgi:phage shock protein PspC (stress-responsive transcriptional regulator)
MRQSLRRPLEDRVLAGVCSGVGQFFNIDPVVIRVGWIILALIGSFGLWLYILAWLVIPDANGQRSWVPVALVLLLALPLLCTVCFGLTTGMGLLFTSPQ